MLGERSDQRGLWEADRLYLDHVGKDTFYGLLASLRGRLFRDADFAEFYCADNGRDSVPPSLLATALLLQTHDKVSDAEAKARADFDLPRQLLGDNSAITGRSGKLARLQEILDEVLPAGDRALLFSQFTETGAILQQHVQETYGLETPFLHGGVTRKQRDRMVERFQNAPLPEMHIPPWC